MFVCSKTGTALNKDFMETDGSLSISGTWYTDVMQHGKAKIKGQPFGVATQVTVADDLDISIDGVLGKF
jgi:hypothetical protein